MDLRPPKVIGMGLESAISLAESVVGIAGMGSSRRVRMATDRSDPISKDIATQPTDHALAGIEYVAVHLRAPE